MSKSYDRNIERLKANQARVSAQEQGITTQAARDSGNWRIKEAEGFAKKLAPFSTALQEWKDKDIKKKIEEGRQDLEKAKLEKAKLLTDTQKKILAIEEAQKAGELAFEIKDAQSQEKELQRLKGSILDQQGTVGYPDAERLAKLSPWQQVGYIQEAIKNGKDAFGDMLAHSMQNGQENIVLGGIEFNAAEIKDNKLAFQMKQHAVHYYADKIYRNLGLHKYSKEMLDRSKVHEHIRTTKEAQIAKHRKEYNIESSMNTQAKAKLQWETGDKTGEDIELFLLTWGNTVNTKNVRHGNSGALDAFFGMLTKKGIEEGGDTTVGDIYKDMLIPESLRQRVNAKPGATFGSHWPNRFKKLEQSITDGRTKYVDNVLKNQENKKNEITMRFDAQVEAAYKEGKALTQAEYQFWVDQYQAIGAQPPEKVTKYKTASERDRLKDVQLIENFIKKNGGITHIQLQSFHPLAAGQFKEKADAFEKATLTDTGADKIIKAALDNTFADMGVKDREKSMAYQIAKKNAEQDFHNQYTEYIGFGLREETALHLALHGVSGIGDVPEEVKTYIQGRQGVAEEINKMGENSKYTRAGLHLENTVGSEFERMAFAMTAKKEMREANVEGKLIRKTKVLGGDYGQKQLDAIKQNIERYGLYRGIAMSKEHVQFYKAIVAGRDLKEGGWWGLIHDQLKADDPTSQGLHRNEVANSILPLLTRKVETPDGEEEDVEDEDGVLEVSSAAINAADNGAALYAYNTITDANNYHTNTSNVSVFDQPDQIPAYLGGIA